MPSCNTYFATSAANCCGRDACGAGGNYGGGGVSSYVSYVFLRRRCLSFCRFHKLIWKLLPVEPERHKLTVRISGSPRIMRAHLREPTVLVMLVLVILRIFSSCVLFCTVMYRQN